MTFDERTAAVTAKGFTNRQARFLVTVMLHSGVCMVRQYCAFARIAHGQNTHDFFAGLLDRKLATAYACAHKRARIFHVHHRALYEAIGEPNNRFRKPTPIGQTIERLMLLDAVMGSPDVTWLATERDKLAHFTVLLRTQLRRDELPHLTFGQADQTTVRFFPDKVPIGIGPDGREHVFTYLVTRSAPIDFRAFLHRHAELLRALPAWTLRLLVPAHFREATNAYVSAWRQEFASPLRPSTADELRWFFEQQRLQADANGGNGDEGTRYHQARRAFAAPRYRVLYRSWLRDGAKAIDGTVSQVLADAITRGTGRIECRVLPHPYLHLSPLVGSA